MPSSGAVRRANDAVQSSDLARRRGRVGDLIGLIIEATGLEAEVGELCFVGEGRRQKQVPTEVVGFHKSREAFAAEHTSIVAVSIDDPQTHLRWARELGGIGYPLLSDEGGALAKAYGVFDESAEKAMRATFILDSKRSIVYCVACPVNVGRSVGETLRVVRALRSGRMCPADWEPDRNPAPPITTDSGSG